MNAAKYALHQLKKYGRNVKREGVIGGVNKVLNDVIEHPVNEYMDGVNSIAKGIGKHMVKKTDKALWNGYTGYKASGAATAAAWAGTAAWGINSVKYKQESMPKTGDNIEYQEGLSSQNYDGVTSTRMAPTLGATGAMVFGMHAGRKG